jgi:hypothetical protein
MDEKKYFEKENDFLKLHYDKFGEILSKISINSQIKINPQLLLEKDFTLEYTNIIELSGNFEYYDAIFKNKSDFYLYLSRKDISEISYHIMVYFKPDKMNEVMFFIKNLIKLKNGN